MKVLQFAKHASFSVFYIWYKSKYRPFPCAVGRNKEFTYPCKLNISSAAIHPGMATLNLTVENQNTNDRQPNPNPQTKAGCKKRKVRRAWRQDHTPKNFAEHFRCALGEQSVPRANVASYSTRSNIAVFKRPTRFQTQYRSNKQQNRTFSFFLAIVLQPRTCVEFTCLIQAQYVIL